MHITSMTATFGKLQHARLDLTAGLNCIYAPNEAGKSTWCRFLLAMFYGISTRDRTPLADKRRYHPWSGLPMQGSMGLAVGSDHYTVTRSSPTAASPMQEFSCVYTGIGSHVPGTDGDTFGEQIIGVPRSVYERSAFISQGSLAVTQDAELERRIISMITSGEEEISYSEVAGHLRQQLNRRQHHHTGRIPQLEAACADLSGRIEHITALQNQLQQLRSRSDHISRETELLQLYQNRWDLLEKQAAYHTAIQQQNTMRQKVQLLQEQAAQAAAQLESHALFGRDDADLDAALAQLSPLPLPSSFPLIAGVFCTVLGLLSGISAFMQSQFPIAIGAGAVLCLGIVLILCRLFKKRRAVRCNNELHNRQTSLAREIAALHTLQNSAAQAQCTYAEFRALYDALPAIPHADLSPVSPPPLDRESTRTQLHAAQQAAIALRSERDRLSGQLAAGENISDLQARYEQAQMQLAVAQSEYDAILLALNALESANTILNNRFAPALSRRTAEIFRVLTGNRYHNVQLDRGFSLSATAAGDEINRPLSLLSQGAGDQLYLAARLAICEAVFPAIQKPPLILDDAFLSFDDERLRAALDMLVTMSEDRQILLFTCQHREADYLRGREGVHISSPE